MDRKYSALVVDDQQNWRDLVGELLNDEFEVSYASDYESAIESLVGKSPPYHLVVTDIRLVDGEKGNEDGIRLLQNLNQYQQFTKTIVLTGYPSIDTAKKALGNQGNAFDYLEKVPASHLGFDQEEFKRIARDAASLADQERPESFTQLDWNILLVEPDAKWRSKLAGSLRKDNYRVDELDTMDLLADTLQAKEEPYGLILARDRLINDTEAFYSAVQKYHPEAKIVILTEQKIGEILGKIQEGLVYSVITLPERGASMNSFRQFVKDAFIPARTKFVLARLKGSDDNASCRVGETCFVELEVRDKWVETATSVRFSPQPGGRGKTQVKVFTFAPDCRLESESERYWEFTKTSGRQFLIELIPNREGEIKISIELEQDNRWLTRVEKVLKVTA